jgi:drug/metabolite transporter (DMT)-like permease
MVSSFQVGFFLLSVVGKSQLLSSLQILHEERGCEAAYHVANPTVAIGNVLLQVPLARLTAPAATETQLKGPDYEHGVSDETTNVAHYKARDTAVAIVVIGILICILSKMANGSKMVSGESHLATSATPPQWQIYISLVVAFAFFGGGSFVSKLGIHGGSPVAFEMTREFLVVPCLLVMTYLWRLPLVPEFQDVIKIGLIGLAWAAGQLCFFVGLKHVDANIASTWEATTPICTAALAALLGQELLNVTKCLSILCASTGAILIAMASAHEHQRVTTWAPHLIFAFRQLLTAFMIVVSKKMSQKYSATSLMTWVFSVGSVFFVIVFAISTDIPALHRFICESPSPELMNSCLNASWIIPQSMLPYVLYEVVACSLISWCLISWANSHTDASIVGIFQVIQPMVTMLLASIFGILYGQSWARSHMMHVATQRDLLGIALIFVGILVHVYAKRDKLRP